MLPSTVLLNIFAPILQFEAELPHLYLHTRALQHKTLLLLMLTIILLGLASVQAC